MKHTYDKTVLKIPPDTQHLDHVIDFISSFLSRNGFDKKSIAQISIAAEEIFTNICRYACLSPSAYVKIDLSMQKNTRAIICFIDGGTAFDPLKATTPDTSLTANKRQEGGLGIYLMQKLVSYVDYKYENGMNILTIVKQKNSEDE